MSVSAIGGSPVVVAPQARAAANAAPAPAAAEAPGVNDHDKDDATMAAAPPAATSSNAVQAALTALKIGG